MCVRVYSAHFGPMKILFYDSNKNISLHEKLIREIGDEIPLVDQSERARERNNPIGAD